MHFDGMVLATPAETSKRWLAKLAVDRAEQESSDMEKTTQGIVVAQPSEFPNEFNYEPITTCYLQYEASIKLERPFFALVDKSIARTMGTICF